MKNKKSGNTNTLIAFLKLLGPGIITAALVFGPGSLTIASKLGAEFQYQLLWVVILATFFMIVFTIMSARIGVSQKRSLIATIKEKYGRAVSLMIGFGVFLVTASFQSGNSIGAGLAFAELFNTASIPWIIIFSLLAISLLFLKSFYKILEKIMIIMIGIMIFSFLITLILSGPEISVMVKGLVPSLPNSSEFLVIALMASSFSIVGAFYQSYLVQERGWKRHEVKKSQYESLTGIIILGMVTFMIMSAAGSVLFPQGIKVNSAAEMGKALEPLFGSLASTIFMIGLFAASFSSLLGNATLGGAVLGDALSLGNKLSALPLRLLIMVVIVTGAVFAVVFSHLQLQLIVIAQATTMIVAPIVGIFIFLVSSSASLMGDLKNGAILKVFGTIGLLIILVLAAGFVYLVLIR
jgi:Mn2+/Fe2+ NRAMP family transporter